MEKKLKDNSPTWFHEDMLQSNNGRKASKMNAFKGYMNIGFTQEEALSMAGLKRLQKK